MSAPSCVLPFQPGSGIMMLQIEQLCFQATSNVPQIGNQPLTLLGSHFSKGMLLDMPMAATEGLRAVPKLYGKEVSERPHITDWKSGAVVAGTNFHQGVVGGFTDLIREPIDGGRQEGALGVAKGVGKGLVGMTTKVTSGMFWFASYKRYSDSFRTNTTGHRCPWPRLILGAGCLPDHA